MAGLQTRLQTPRFTSIDIFTYQYLLSKFIIYRNAFQHSKRPPPRIT